MKYLLSIALILSLFCSYAQDSATAPRDTVGFWHGSFEDFRTLARFENKPYFIMFSASWCAPCQRMKKDIFTNQRIAVLSNQNYLAYYMDLENFDDVEINSKLFKVSQLPTILFFDPLGKQIDSAIGFYDGYYFFRKLRVHIPPSRWGTDWADE